MGHGARLYRVEAPDGTIRWMNKITGRYLLIALFGIALMFLCEYLGFFVGLNNYVYDLIFRIRGPQSQSGQVNSDRIVIAAIDEKSLGKLGRWPISRHNYAGFLEKVNEAAVVGFDIIMAEPSEDDPLVADEIKKHGRVVLPVYFDKSLASLYPASTIGPVTTGHIHVEPDIDGVLRKVFLSIRSGNVDILSFSRAIYGRFSSGRQAAERRVPQQQGEAGDRKLLQTGAMRINYAGPAGTFQTVSFVDVLDGRYPQIFFRSRIVLVGLTAAGLEDRVITPFSQHRNRMSGVEAHANIISNLMDGNDIKEIAPWLRIGISLIIPLLAFFMFMKMTERRAAGLWIVLVILTSFGVYSLLIRSHLWLEPALIYVSVTFIYGIVYLFRLDEAARRLDREYAEVSAQLRWQRAGEMKRHREKGLTGFLSAGGINAKIGFLTDTINQMIFEKRLIDAALLSNIHGIVLFNPEGKLVVENELAHALFHSLTARFEDLDDFHHLFSPYLVRDESDIDEHNNNHVARFRADSTFVFSAPDGKYLKMDSSLIPFNDQQYLLCVFTDVTKLKELELLKGQIVSMVTHELKQPLTIIYCMGELLQQELTGNEKTDMETINREIQRMVQFISRFLDISRLESGREEIRKETVDIMELIQETGPHFRTLADIKKAAVKIKVPEKISPVMADRELTRQCLINLVENAVKYGPEGGEVMIELDNGPNLLRIDITDNGPGIEESELGKIFDKFYRGKSAVEGDAKGSGLGLAFVKHAIEAQGGTVSVKSRPGNGSTFSISFPVDSDRINHST